MPVTFCSYVCSGRSHRDARVLEPGEVHDADDRRAGRACPRRRSVSRIEPSTSGTSSGTNSRCPLDRSSRTTVAEPDLPERPHHVRPDVPGTPGDQPCHAAERTDDRRAPADRGRTARRTVGVGCIRRGPVRAEGRRTVRAVAVREMLSRLSISRGHPAGEAVETVEQHGRESACPCESALRRQSAAPVRSRRARRGSPSARTCAESVERAMARTAVRAGRLRRRARAAGGRDAVRRRRAAVGRPRGRRRRQAHASAARGRRLPGSGRRRPRRDRARRRRVEVLHTAMLVHDDLLDHDEVRRGRPTWPERRVPAWTGAGSTRAGGRRPGARRRAAGG